MSRENTPRDNAVGERFMRTFKQHEINGKIMEQAIQEIFITNVVSHSKNKKYRSIINTYVKKLNKKPNKKSLPKSSENYDRDVSTASIFMQDPLYPKAFSESFGTDKRRVEIEKYKYENFKVISLLEEFATKKAEIVDETPFDSFENNLALEIIEKQLNELYRLIQNNQSIIRKSVEQGVERSIEPLNENLDDIQEQLTEEMKLLNKKIDRLLPKIKKERKIQPLRDPIDMNLFPLFLTNVGNQAQRMKDLRRAQLRIAYTILYHCGLQINEIRNLTQQDIETAIKAAQFNIIHHKTRQAHVHILSKKAIQDLRDCKLDFSVIFEKYKYKFLFGKHKPIYPKYLIDLINKDLKGTCLKFGIPFNIKSHSFRINMITNLLKVPSVQNTADIIGYSDIRSTMQYNRYALSKTEIQDLLNQISHNSELL